MVEKKKEKNKQKVVKNGKKLGEMEFKIREPRGAYDSRILIVRSFDYCYLILYPKEVERLIFIVSSLTFHHRH